MSNKLKDKIICIIKHLKNIQDYFEEVLNIESYPKSIVGVIARKSRSPNREEEIKNENIKPSKYIFKEFYGTKQFHQNGVNCRLICHLLMRKT